MNLITLTLFNLVFVIAAAIGWPIYQSASYLWLVGISLILANSIALVGALKKISTAKLVIATALLYLVLGVPLAIPSALADLGTFVAGFGRLITAPVTAWKDLLTLSLPVGSYQTALVPAFIVFLVVPITAISVALRAEKLWMLGALIALIPLIFVISFGSSNTSGPLRILGLTLSAPLEIIAAVVSFIALLLWLMYRRDSALTKTAAGQVQKVGAAKRYASSILILAIGLSTALVIVPAIMTDSTRDVLRVQIDPTLKIQAEVSPLANYRASFTNELFDTELFQVDAASKLNRIRIATMTEYNGQVVTTGGPSDADTASTFSRTPALLSGRDEADETRVRISALTGIWLPTASNLLAVDFSGERQIALADGFFYNYPLEAGVELIEGGLKSGDEYVLQTTAASIQAQSLTDLKPGQTQPRIDPAFVPQSLQDWLALQKVDRSGEGLAELIERLRSRGYLSHALSVDSAKPPEWMKALPGYEFEPSRAGHSTARIDQMFTDLLKKQREVGSASDAELVAAVGDDEQFALAAMLLADQLGFNSRVVLGTNLTSAEAGSISPCQNGRCTGANLTAWLEVQSSDGQWVAVDVTPQFENPIAPDVDRQQDPQNVTQVNPPSVDPVQPPESKPSQSKAKSSDAGTGSLDLTWLLTIGKYLRVLFALAIALLAVPLVIWWQKRTRTRARRTIRDPNQRAIEGFDEFVDSHLDHGFTLERSQTRQEIVSKFSAGQISERDLAIAAIADRAVFDQEAVSGADADQMWELVDARERELTSNLNRRQRVRALISLRSFARGIAAHNWSGRSRSVRAFVLVGVGALCAIASLWLAMSWLLDLFLA